MSSNDELSSGIKLSTFNGEQSSYQIWLIRFQVFARVKRFLPGLVMQASLPESEAQYNELLLLDSPIFDGKKQILAGYVNGIVIAQ